MKLENVLKSYDKMLRQKKRLDGSIEIYRQSPFNVDRQHPIITIKNQYLGSCYWIRTKFIKMDNQRFDLVGDVLRTNKKIQEKKDNRNIHEEITNFFVGGGDIFIN